MKTDLKAPVAVGLAVGIYFGIALFLCALVASWFGYCKIFVSFMSTFYIGYKANFFGAIVGILRGFIDGFVAGFVITRLTGYFKNNMK
ncbi:MAG: hypothetical protein NTY80_05125 [candidate division SR1 bacterium]|nr:hypothetical protein [candidate division SR1 bacterium]